MSCTSGCPTQDCPSYGACLRNKGVQIDTFSLTQAGKELDKRKDHTLKRFRDLASAGITPASPLKKDVDAAEKKATASA